MQGVLSVGKAQAYPDLAAALVAAKQYADKPVTITISGGRYAILAPLTITQSNLTLCAAAGEEVIFTGCLPMANETWHAVPENHNIYYTQLPANLAVDGFFVDDVPQILARYPKYQVGVLPLGGVVSADALKARAAHWAHPETGYLRALHSKGWGGNDYYITGKDAAAETGLTLDWIGDNNRGHEYMPSSVMVEGIFEELSAEHEWFYCAKTGLFYFYPPADFDFAAPHNLEAAVCSELFTLRGDSVENPLSNIQISGITFQNTKRSMFATKQNEDRMRYIPLLRGDWAVARTGAIYAEHAKRISITDCNFYNIGGNALFFYGYQEAHTITRNRFCHLGACGIQLVGDPCAVDDASFWPHAHYPDLQVHATKVQHPAQIGPIRADYPRDITIAQNYLHDIGQYEKQSSGINLSVTSRIRILHNTIHKSARSNINVNDGSFGGHEIAYNDIFDAQLETTDHGPFNAWGRDRFWSVPAYNAIGKGGEVIRHYPDATASAITSEDFDTALLDAYQTTEIHHNRFHHAKGAPHSWGIDLDDGSSNYTIHSNLCLGIGIKLREGFNRKVYNNILIDGKLEIHVSYTHAQDEIRSNLVVNHQPWNFIAVDEARYTAAEYRVSDNWYYNFGAPIVLPAWFAGSHPDGTKTADIRALLGDNPHFANPAENDYTPTNTQAMDAIHFAPFTMHRFGAEIAPTQAPYYLAKPNTAQESITYLWQRATICDITEAIISATASADRQGVYIVKIGDASAKLGLRTHDIIKEVNGEAVVDCLDFSAKMAACNDAPTTLTLYRESAQYRLTL